MTEQAMEEPKKHPHALDCENFKEALEMGFLIQNGSEINLINKLPESSEIGNILTGESYDKNDYLMGYVIRFCPFCSKSLKYTTPDIESLEQEALERWRNADLEKESKDGRYCKEIEETVQVMRCHFCVYGHMTGCHFPFTCDQIDFCGH